jgi:serine/threonine protein kinase
VPHLAGAVVGTPQYMAPEQLLGEPPSERTDMYAAGIVLHECLTGATPFQADTPLGFLAHKLEPGAAPGAAPPPAPDGPRRDDAPPSRPRALEEVVARMTAHDPERRPASFEALQELLDGLR